MMRASRSVFPQSEPVSDACGRVMRHQLAALGAGPSQVGTREGESPPPLHLSDVLLRHKSTIPLEGGTRGG